MENSEHVDAQLNYLEDRGQRPTTYTYAPPPGVSARTGKYAKFPVAIHNARPLARELSLDRQGVALIHQDSAVRDFYSDREVREVYYPEVERMVREATGAARVLVFDYNLRCRARAKQGEKGIQEPVKVAHNDYTIKSGPQRVRDLLPAEADELLKNRFAVINVWRPIRGPVQESPLAVCDAQSIEAQDFVIHELIYRDRKGEVYSVAYNPKHRWYYFPQMAREEVMLLKCYDSRTDVARFSAHSAFDDPTSAADPVPRESIEVRTLAFFNPPA
ncbi:MAG: CmcJ/NvfI family oxidoreductase [Candidatus Binataceae bacterium]